MGYYSARGTTFYLEKMFSIEVKVFSVNMWLIKVVITSMGGSFHILLPRHSFSAEIPSVRVMFEYKDLMSIVTKIVLCGILLMCFILIIRSFVSRI